MQVYGEIAARPTIGPLPSTVQLGRAITDLNPGLLRSGFEGQANAILVAPAHTILSRHVLTLNPPRFRLREARRRTAARGLLAWGKERRQCMAVRLEGGLIVANLHATKARNPGSRTPRSSVRPAGRPGWRAMRRRSSRGDFNVDTARSVAIDLLDGYTKAGPGIDHVVARGASTVPTTAGHPNGGGSGSWRSPTMRRSRWRSRDVRGARRRLSGPREVRVPERRLGRAARAASTHDALAAAERDELVHGRATWPYFERMLEARGRLRTALAAEIGVEPS